MWNNRITYSTSVDDMKEWAIFRNVERRDILDIKAIYVFKTRNHATCEAGSMAAIYLTSTDMAYCLGHNCENVNFFGFPVDNGKATLPHEVLSPMIVAGLSGIYIVDIAVGGSVGAAVTADGRLLWWGRCYSSEKGPMISEPHPPAQSESIFFKKVVVGDQMMIALSTMYNVYVWGIVDPSTSESVECFRIQIDTPIVDVSCGLFHAALIDFDGVVYMWSRHDLKNYCILPFISEKCVKVRCGPLSTFCLTTANRVLTCSVYLDLVDIGLSNIEDIVVYRTDVDAASLVVSSADGGKHFDRCRNVSLPMPASESSLYYEFQLHGATPNLLPVQIYENVAHQSHDVHMPVESADHEERIPIPEPVPCSLRVIQQPTLFNSYYLGSPQMPQVNQGERRQGKKTITGSDVLTYIYLRDRPELEDEFNDFLEDFDHDELEKCATENFDSGDDGQDYILNKFLNSIVTCSAEFFV